MMIEGSAVRFWPWIGSRYAKEGFRDLRVLVVCESHYGDKRYERPTVTPEIVKALALGQKHPSAIKKLARHRHFSRIFAAVNNASRSGVFSTTQRGEFWSRVAYYNFVQEFMPKARKDPTPEAWARGASAFREVLATLDPQLILCFSSRNGHRVESLAGTVPVAVVNHPSSPRFAYALVNPRIREAMDDALARQARDPSRPFIASEVFQRWQLATEAAPAAAGRHLPPAELSANFTSWKAQLDAIDRIFDGSSRADS